MTAEERSSKKVDSNTDLNSMVYTEKKNGKKSRSKPFSRTFEKVEQLNVVFSEYEIEKSQFHACLVTIKKWENVQFSDNKSFSIVFYLNLNKIENAHEAI